MSVAPQALDKSAIEALIPHSGAMSLLERVVASDEQSIRCEAVSHADPANPLRHNGVLPASAGVEYAAQAVALHAAITKTRAGGAPQRGYLAVLSNAAWSAPRLDDAGLVLTVEAAQITVLASGSQYSFRLSAAGRELLTGEFILALEAAR
ncbi:MAG: hypothetical protein ABW199_12135 [Caulobacterales bacterium]